MADFEGDLLIGGLTLRHLHGELEEEVHEEASTDWLLAGKIIIGPDEQRLLQIGRRYRLQLADGRAGQVVICSLAEDSAAHYVAEFEAHGAPSKPR